MRGATPTPLMIRQNRIGSGNNPACSERLPSFRKPPPPPRVRVPGDPLCLRSCSRKQGARTARYSGPRRQDRAARPHPFGRRSSASRIEGDFSLRTKPPFLVSAAREYGRRAAAESPSCSRSHGTRSLHEFTNTRERTRRACRAKGARMTHVIYPVPHISYSPPHSNI